MSIKFLCPHCHELLRVKEELGGKRGPCPRCKKPVTVPCSSDPELVARPVVPRPPVDIEAEAAAILSEKSAETPKSDPESIAFDCPQCGDPVSLTADLAGKNAPCPSCRRIIKVPLPKKLEAVDWRKPNAGLPSLARQNQPAPEGVWDNKESARVSLEALEEAGALPDERPPRTLGQRVTRGLVLAAAVAFLLTGAFWIRNRAAEETELALTDVAQKFVKSEAAPRKLGPEGMAELHRALGLHHLRTGKPGCAVDARREFETARGLLRNGQGPERDLALAELALAVVELGGVGDEVDEERRVAWDDQKNGRGVHSMLRAVLSQMKVAPARMETLRAVMRRMIARGQAGRVEFLAAQVFGSDGEAERLEAVATAGLELLAAGDRSAAGTVAERLKKEYARKENRPPLSPAAVALLFAVKPDEDPPRAAGKSGPEADLHLVGYAEGLARQGKWDQARDQAASAQYPELRLRAQLGLAAAALDAGRNDRVDLDAALQTASTLPDKARSQWLLWRLLYLGLRAGTGEERLQSLVEALPQGPVRSRAQLAILRVRLAASATPAEPAASDAVDKDTLSHTLAFETLARHNARHGGRAAARAVVKWEESNRAFGAVGAALGLQGD
jgi:hypothetical protein